LNSVKSDIDWRMVREIIWRASVFIVAVIILIVVVTRWNHWQGDAEWQTTDDAYLQSDVTPIATKVAGYVRDLPMQDYDHVRAGQLLAQIVDDDYRALVAQAEANIAAAVAQLGNRPERQLELPESVPAARPGAPSQVKRSRRIGGIRFRGFERAEGNRTVARSLWGRAR
jgi:membrane fusion protein (multidrug efflux system)